MRHAFLPLLFALAACQVEGSGQDAATAGLDAPAETPSRAPLAEPVGSGASAPLVALDGEGLRLVLDNGATRLLAFGAPRAQAEQAIGAALGQAERSANDECGAGPLEFSRYGALQLVFQDSAFAGWVVDRAGSLSTIDGVAIGSTAAQVQDTRALERVPDSTLGEEFTLGGGAGAIGGLFGGAGAEAKVTLLFAGTTCFFR